MKKQILILLAFTFGLAGSAQAQFGRMNSTDFNSIMARLFGDNPSFTADLEVQTGGPQTGITPGKIALDSGKSRFELNFGEAKGGQAPPGFADRLKMMGMDKIVILSRPDAKLTDTLYPGLSSYVETSLQDTNASKPDSAFKITTTEISRESLDGHPCVKNKVVITDDQGKSHLFTVWNAVDLKKFALKIETNEQGRSTTMLFSNVKTSKPDAAFFEPPSDYKKYDSQQALQQEIMKRVQGMMTRPAHP